MGCLTSIFVIIYMGIVIYISMGISEQLNLTNGDGAIVLIIVMSILPISYLIYRIIYYIWKTKRDFEGILKYPVYEVSGSIRSLNTEIEVDKAKGEIRITDKLTIPIVNVINSEVIGEANHEHLTIQFINNDGEIDEVIAYSNPPNRKDYVRVLLGADIKINHLIEKDEDAARQLHEIERFLLTHRGNKFMEVVFKQLKEYDIKYCANEFLEIHFLNLATGRYNKKEVYGEHILTFSIEEINSYFAIIVCSDQILITNHFENGKEVIYKCLYSSFTKKWYNDGSWKVDLLAAISDMCMNFNKWDETLSLKKEQMKIEKRKFQQEKLNKKYYNDLNQL